MANYRVTRFYRRRRPTSRWTGATGSDFRIIIGPAKLLGDAVARQLKRSVAF